MKMALTRIGKEKIRQLTPITEGGEGYIYEFGNDILKIYKPCIDIAAKEKKVAMLIDKPLPKEAIKPITAAERGYDMKETVKAKLIAEFLTQQG